MPQLRGMVGIPLAGILPRTPIMPHPASLSCLILQQKPQHLAFAALHHADKFLVLGATRLPAFHHIIPCARSILQQPVLGFGIEMRRESTIDDIFFLLLVVVRGNVELQFVAQWYSSRHPDLAQFVVAMALKAVIELFAMLLQVVGQSKPFDGEQEHPVYCLLECLVPAGVLVDPAHTLLTMAQVEGL